MHLYLTGYRGTGKSSVALLLARRLQRPWMDLDHLIEANAGKTIRDIFADGGEALFRDLESAALEIAAQADPAVIALGGGAVLRPHNRQLIRDTGICVWLTASPSTIAQRLAADPNTPQNRPSLTALDGRSEIETLLQQRHSAYQSAADYAIDTEGKSIDEVAGAVVAFAADHPGW